MIKNSALVLLTNTNITTNTINYKISHLNGLIDHYLNELKHNMIKPTSLSPMFIFVIYDNKSNHKEEGEGEEGDGEKDEK